MTSTIATLHGALENNADGPPRCQLVVVEGNDMGRAAAFGAGEMVVGTDSACDLVLRDERVSGQHLALQSCPQGFVVRDLESRNGTLFSGSRIHQATVPVGATLKIGHSYLRIQPQPEPLEVEPSQSRRFGELVAESLAMREVFAVLELAAGSEMTVLLEGETGTGKELAARALHEASARRKAPFVAIDCGALPENLLESELFGHIRGAFTGAARDRRGAFNRAQGGTVFLDELDSVPLTVQSRLLRVIEERRLKAVGSDQEQDIDVRLVGASRAELSSRVAEGTFRPDLYYRLSVLRVVLPPLRQRREDIAPIVGELLRLRGAEFPAVLGPNLDRLVSHDWPGNVRELRNVIDRAITLSPKAEAFSQLRLSLSSSGDNAADDPLAIRTDIGFADAKQRLVQVFERRYLRDLLARHGGNISATARAADLDRKHLKTLLRKHKLVVEPAVE